MLHCLQATMILRWASGPNQVFRLTQKDVMHLTTAQLEVHTAAAQIKCHAWALAPSEQQRAQPDARELPAGPPGRLLLHSTAPAPRAGHLAKRRDHAPPAREPLCTTAIRPVANLIARCAEHASGGQRAVCQCAPALRSVLVLALPRPLGSDRVLCRPGAEQPCPLLLVVPMD